jgi:predicted TIM-barrel fold metal-dependent hydrolase
MLRDDVKVISVDDHLIEHPRAWLDRLPAKYQEAGPQLVELADGTEQWSYAGIVEGAPGLAAVAGTPWSERNNEPTRFDQMRQAYYDPAARCTDMDVDGVATQILFPSFARFAGARFLRGEDRQLALACVRAYNDYALEVWQGYAPERLIPLTILPLWDIDLCTAEMARCLELGSHGVSLPDSPAMLGLATYRSGYWAPLLALLDEAGVPMCTHFGSAGVTPTMSADAPQAAQAAVMPVTIMSSLAELVLSPIFTEHPHLNVVLSESGIGWIPYLSQRLDQVWEHYRYYALGDELPETAPSLIMGTRIYSCFIDDPLGVELRGSIGVSQLMWESDFPHPDSLYPLSRTNAVKVMAEVPDAEVEMIMRDNAKRVFHL